MTEQAWLLVVMVPITLLMGSLLGREIVALLDSITQSVGGI